MAAVEPLYQRPFSVALGLCRKDLVLNMMQQAATTSTGAIGIISVGAKSAVYHLDLLSQLPQQDIHRLDGLRCLSWCFFRHSAPQYYIIKQKFVFHTPTVTAYTIKQLHSIGGAVIASKRAK